MDTFPVICVANTLRRLRVEGHLTQHQLAERLARPQSFVSKLERGERHLRLDEVFPYAAALGIEPTHLMDELMEETKRLEKR